MKAIHVCTSLCHHLASIKGASLEQHGQQRGTLSGTGLNMYLKPQQTAEMNTPYYLDMSTITAAALTCHPAPACTLPAVLCD